LNEMDVWFSECWVCVLPKEIVESDRRDDRYKEGKNLPGTQHTTLFMYLYRSTTHEAETKKKKDFQLLTVQDRDLPPASHRWVPET
jgi:hypothetical protein